MKKLFVFLMTVFALMCLTTGSASADGVSWSVDAEGTLTISGTGAMTDYASASAVPWVGEDIYAVIVEEGVTHVGSYAFSGLFLDNVLLPETLESIGDHAFYGAAVTEAHFAGNLKQWRENITLGNGNDVMKNVIAMDKDVTYQGEGFSLTNGVVTSYVSALPGDFKREYNDYVFEVVFAGVTEIGREACGSYYGDSLTKMTSVTIPDSVDSIGGHAFDGCNSLTSVTIPDSVISIGDRAFYECEALSSVFISDISAWCRIEFGHYEDNPLYFARNLYLNGDLITELVIPKNVTSISNYAFSGCGSLISLTIPNNVTSIGLSAFRYCNNLKDVIIGNGITRIEEAVFSDCRSLTNITIPESVTRLGRYAFGCCNLINVTIPDSVTSIDEYAFYCCSLTSVTIPDSVTSIGLGAFNGCNSLTSVTIPDSVTSIGGEAFCGCKMTSITIPEGVTDIAYSMFNGCTSLMNVTIPDSVTSIGGSAFYDCRSLANVYYLGTTAMWDEITIESGNDALLNAARHCAMAAGDTGDCCWSLSESGTLRISGDGRMADYTEGAAPWYAYRGQLSTIEINDKVTYIGSYAFSGLENVPAASGMTSVTGIGEGVFKNCSALASLTLPASVTSMGQNAFSGCTLLTSAGPVDSGAAIEFGWNRAIPANAFNGADCLETLTIPEGVTRVMPFTAANCTALSAVSLPTTLVNIQQNAFSGCASLEEITLPDALKTIGVSTFQNTGLTSVTIPLSATTIGNNSFDGSFLADVYYPGSRNQWNAITIGADNTALSGATYHFGRFDITFDTDGGSVIEPIALVYGQAVIPPANPTKANAVFLRWEPALPASMPANDLTLKAIWAPVFGAPDFRLPAAIKQIEEEAFAGVTNITVVEIPNGCASIGKWAFKDCTGLTQIRIPASVTNIDDLAFDDCADVFIYGTSPSTAKSFCDAHINCKFVEESASK